MRQNSHTSEMRNITNFQLEKVKKKPLGKNILGVQMMIK
jgi:hypothetical protein